MHYQWLPQGLAGGTVLPKPIKYMWYQRHGWNIWYNEHYMSKSVSHALSNPSGRWSLGWYRVLRLIRHVIHILTCSIQYITSNWSDINISTNKQNKNKNKTNKQTQTKNQANIQKKSKKKESFMEFLHTHYKFLAYPTRHRH